MAAGRDLAGALVGVTAWRRADEQAELLARRGARVVRAPTVKLVPLGAEEAVREATVALLDEPPDVVVANTGVGMRTWLALADSWGLGESLTSCLGRARVVARGPKAAGAMLTAGLEVDWRAPTDRLAEVVDHLVSVGVAGCRVALQLDGSVDGGEAVERLGRAGASVVAVPVYRWALPEDVGPARRLAAAVAEGRIDAVTFTAAPAVENFFAIAAGVGAAEAVREALNGPTLAVCVGPVCVAAAAAHGVRAVCPERARLGAMVQALAQEWRRRRTRLVLGERSVELRGATVAGNGREVALRGRERQLFGVLARRPGAVVPRASLLAEVWRGAASPRALEAAVSRLRHTLAPVGLTVEAVRRRGYRLAPTPQRTRPNPRTRGS